MDHGAALKLAIDLMHFPAQVRSVRSAPLPDDVLLLLRIVAEDEEAIIEATESGRSRGSVREAAAFFIEQILLHQGADSYRVLGTTPEVTYGELRRNMALLLRWLHPDRDRQGERAVFAARVTRAWSDLKTEDRRFAYDLTQRISLAEKSLHRTQRETRSRSKMKRSNGRTGCRPHDQRILRFLHSYPDKRRGLLRRILQLFFGRAALDTRE
jgi:hypothetical protein